MKNRWQRWVMTADELVCRARQAFAADSAPATRGLRLTHLEPRILFSAVPIDPAVVDGGQETATVSELSTAPEESTGEQTTIATLAESRAGEIVIIDSAVPDLKQLLEDLAGREVQVFVLDGQRDGVDQITEILDGRSDVTSVHVVSHAEDGAVKLGNMWLGESNLDGYAGQIASWQGSLAVDADILLYGCDLASNDSGRALVDSIATLSGADVAASTDDTGHAKFLADWDLEYSTGLIETSVPFSAELQATWESKLAIITVDTLSDVIDGGDGLTSLREALIQVNAGAGGDTIQLGVGTHVMTINSGPTDESDDFDIRKSVTITGVSPTQTIIDGGGLYRVFQVHDDAAINVSFSNLKIQNGFVSNANGAGLSVKGGAFSPVVQVQDVWFSNNHATGASGDGGSVRNNGDLTLTNVLVDGSTSGNAGGGVVNEAGAVLTMTNVTLSGNSAGDAGGGLHNDGTATVTNATVVLNNATNGGGISNTGTFNIRNTLVAVNTAISNDDVEGGFSTLNNNLIGDGTGSTGLVDGVNGDQVGTNVSPIDPSIDPALFDNGGPTPTHALFGNSTAINGGTTTGAPAADQRGTVRDATPDIGAYEFVNSPPSVSSGGTLLYNEGDGKVLLDPGITVSDPDGYISSATVRLIINHTAPEDQLHFTNQNGITGSYNSTTGILSLSGMATAAEYETALRSVEYENTSINPNENNRTVQIQVNDGFANSGTTRFISISASGPLAVDTTSDTEDGDISSISALTTNKGADGKVSLREAIKAANNTLGLDTIEFRIADPLVGGAHTITVGAGGLPGITEAVILDGTTDSDYSGSPIVVLNGASAGAAIDGLDISGGGTTVKGLVIQQFTAAGIWMHGGGGNTIQGNYIGTDVTGTIDLGNGDDGIAITNSDNNQIGGTDPSQRNVISGNNFNGIIILNSDGNTVEGNYIGTDYLGSSAVGNTFDGIRVNSGSINNTIGGTANGAENVISGNTSDGIQINDSGTDGNKIYGNLIGTDAAGSGAIANGASGIYILTSAANNEIGGTTAGMANTIGHNTAAGIALANDAGDGNAIRQNSIHTVGTVAIKRNGGNADRMAPAIASVTTDGGTSITVSGTYADVGAPTETLTIEYFLNSSNVQEAKQYLGSDTILTDVGGDATVNHVIAANVAAGDWITATATDSLGNTSELSVAVQSIASNSPPAVANAIPDQGATQDSPFSFQFASNTFDDPDSDPLTYTATLDDSSPLPAWLSFDGGTRTFSGTPANADVGTITIRVTATDPSTASTFDDFVLTINNVNDPPTDITLDNTTVIENSAGAVVGNVAVVDPDTGDSHTWGVDDARFEIVGLQLKLKAGQSLDFESEPTVNVTITATDQGGAGAAYNEVFVISVTDDNDAPVAVNDNHSGMNEGATYVRGAPGVLSNDTDQDGDTLTASIVTGPSFAASFVLNADGSYSYQHDGSETTLDSFVYRVWDGSAFSNDATVTLNINPRNDAPSDITLDNATVAENDNGAVIGNVSVTDPDVGDTHTWSVDDARFELVGTQLKLKAGQSLDYETESSVNVTITVTDQGGAGDSYDEAFVITVIDGDETPTDLTFALNSIEENSANGTVVGDAAGVDPERDATIAQLLAADPNLSYSATTGKFYKHVATTNNWSTSATNATTTMLNGVAGQLVTIRSAAEQAIVLSIAQGTGQTIWMGGSDQNIEGQWYWYDGLAEGTQFWTGDNAGSPVGGEYNNWESPNEPNNLGNEDFLRMYASGPRNGNWDDGQGTASHASIIEWDADDVLDQTDALVYSLVDDAGGRFAIDSDSGQITVADGTLLNYEAATSHSITVRVTDGSLNTYDEAVIINLDDVNESPTDITLDNLTVSENSDGGIVGNVGVVDPDAGDTHAWNVDDARFEVVGGQLKLKAGQSLDKEAEPTVNLSLIAVDQGGAGLLYSESFVITVTNVNEAPTDITLDNTNINENVAGGLIGNLGFSDPDTGDTHTWSVDDTRFEVVGTQLRLKAGQSLDKESEPTVNLTITATDQGGTGLAYNEAFVITVNDVNEAPVADKDTYNVLSGKATTISAGQGVLVGDADPEGAPLNAILFSTTANGTLALNADGSFTYTPNVGFTGVDTFEYLANDGGLSSLVTQVQINVSPIIVLPPPPPVPDVDPAPEKDPPPDPDKDPPKDEEDPTNEESDTDPPDDRETKPPTAGPPGEPSEETKPSDEEESSDEEVQVFVMPTQTDTPTTGTPGTSEPLPDVQVELELRSEQTSRDRADLERLLDTRTEYALMARPGALWNELDNRLNHVDSQIHGDLIIVGTAGAAASSFTVGVVAWGVRTGFLASGLLAQMPAWKGIDPLLIMQSFGVGEGGETLEELMKRQSKTLDS